MAGVYAADGSQRVSITNVEGGTIGLTVDTTGLAEDATLDSTNTKLDTLIAAIGSPSDAAYGGSGDGSVIAVLKAILAATP